VLRDLRTGLLISTVGMLVIAALLTVSGVVDVVDAGFDLSVLLLGTLVFAISGLVEEVLFRLLVLGGLRRLLHSAVAALVLSSLAFAGLELLTTDGTTTLSVISTVLGGFMYGVAYLRSGRLWLPVGLHFGWNWVQGTILGFPVSGTTDYSGAFATLRTTGADWLGGGDYGPEGSVFSLVGRLVIIALVVVATRQSPSWPSSDASSGTGSPRTRNRR
jgi:membrane protease YdiL (CAAX protease family)